MSNLNDFLEYDPNAVEKLNRTMGIKATQKPHKPKRKIIDTNTRDKAEDSLKSIREMLKG